MRRTIEMFLVAASLTLGASCGDSGGTRPDGGEQTSLCGGEGTCAGVCAGENRCGSAANVTSARCSADGCLCSCGDAAQ